MSIQLNKSQEKAMKAKEHKVLVVAAAGSGKAVTNSTILITPTGKRKVNDIKVGDYLFDRNGNPTKVLGVYPQGKKEVYELTFGDGRKAKCSKDHIWRVYCRGSKNYKDLTVEEILQNNWEGIDNRGHKSHNFSIPCASAVKYSNNKELTINPYLFGVFLGDGCCTKKPLTLSSNDEEIVNNIKDILNVPKIHKENGNYNWYFYKKLNDNSRIQTEEVFDDYKDFICCYSYEKSIPDDFKYTSIENRYALIQGLMDTDGSICYNKGRYNVNFSTTSPKLRDDFIEVMGSLGYICTYSIDKRNNKYTNGEAYKILINIPNNEKYKLFRLKRKKDMALKCINKKQNRNYNRTTIRDIKDLGYEEEMTCFYVDNEEHLFLMNDYIVTHNTIVLTERIKYLLKQGYPSSKIVAVTFTNMAAEEIRSRIPNAPSDLYIGTIHSYANKLLLQRGIDTSSALANQDFNWLIEQAKKLPNKPSIEHLLIDEFQDLCKYEYDFIQSLPINYFYAIGDPRQFIYAFKSASDDFIFNLYNDPQCRVYKLQENYRNCNNIIQFAESMIVRLKRKIPCMVIPQMEGKGYIEKCSLNTALDDLYYSGDWNNWFILARTNAEVEFILKKLKDMDIPATTFKKADMDLYSMETLMQEDTVKVLTVHSAKGLEREKVIMVGARYFNEDEDRINYVAATRAKRTLYWCPSPTNVKRNKYADNRKSTKVTSISMMEW